MTRNRIIVAVVLIVVVLLLYLYLRPAAAPWEASGRLVVAIRPVPGPPSDLALGVGLDDMVLHRSNGETQTASILTRRIILTPGDSDLYVLLDQPMAVGDYSGFSFTLKSPSLTNPWQDDEAPEGITIPGERVSLMSPYVVRENETTTIILNVETVQALHEKDGMQIYLPVVQIETRNGSDASVSATMVQIRGGEITSSATYGMTWEGTMRYNFRERTPVQEPAPTAEPEPAPTVETAPAATSSSASTTDAAETTTATTTDEEPDAIESL